MTRSCTRWAREAGVGRGRGKFCGGDAGAEDTWDLQDASGGASGGGRLVAAELGMLEGGEDSCQGEQC